MKFNYIVTQITRKEKKKNEEENRENYKSQTKKVKQ